VPSKSAYASNLLLVRKPDPSSEGGVKNRVCASFVQLNTQTEKDSYPLPNIQYIFDKIGRSKWFTTMDLLSGFWQVMIKPEHRHKTAFITMRGLYEFAVMPFGLCNAPATFQRLMDAVILPEYRDFIETYIDDLMTHSQTFTDHLKHLDVLLTALKKNRLVVKLGKCKFAQLEVKFLGHVISQNSIKTNPEAVEAVKKWMKPAEGGKKAVTAVRGFLGMAGWYRKFIPNFADIARPLVHLTKNNVQWNWSDECQKAFETIRDKLTASPVLAVADPNKQYILHTDASDHAMGAILMQEDDDHQLHPIAYASKTFNDAQRNYDTTEREALAIIWALQHFNTYCEGHRYTLMTDHQALSYIQKNKDSSKRIARWQNLMSNYAVDIFYKSGSTNFAADLLSRQLMQLAPSIRVNVFSTVHRPEKKKRLATSTSSKETKESVRTEDEYEVESIVAKRLNAKSKKGEHEYLVKWKGYDASENTWEPAGHLSNSVDLLAEFANKEFEVSKSDPSPKNPEKIEELAQSPPDDNILEQPSQCCICKEMFANEAAMHVHRFHTHSIQIPTDRLKTLPMTVDIDTFKALQRSDSSFKIVFDTDLGKVEYEEMSIRDRKMMASNEYVLSENGLLYCIETSTLRSRSKVNTQLRLCIPKTERRRLLYHYHDECAHPGIIHLYETLKEKVWWPRLLSDVIRYVQSCRICQVNKGIRNKYLPRSMNIPTGPWSHLAIDHIGPFPMSNGGNRYILVIIDRFTRYVEAYACPDETAHTTAQIIIDKVICRYGFMSVLQSDRGAGFTLMQQILKQLRIKKVKTTAHHPESNGVVEIFNKTLKKTLKLWVSEQQNDWDVLLPYAIFAYNTSYHTTIKQTPFYMNHGREARTIVDQVTEEDVRNNSDTHVYAYELAHRLFKVHQRVKEIYALVNEQREREIENENVVTYKVGDRIWLYDPTTPVQRSKKLVKRWKGPYVIIRMDSDVNVTILRNRHEMTVNVARIRPYDQGIDSIEEQHKRDIELANEEIRVINESITSMKKRRETLMNEKSISSAGLQIEADNEINNNNDEETHAVSHSSTSSIYDKHDEHEELYDYEDEEDANVNGDTEIVGVVSMSFVQLW
jgi:transposase InsO family protein